MSVQDSVRIVPALIVLFSLASCSEDQITTVRDDGPPPTPATLEERIQRTNEFALAFYRESRGGQGNFVICPHSIITCFGMAYAGARGATERQIAEVMHFNYPQAGFHSVLKDLNDALTSPPVLPVLDIDTYNLHIANGVWGREGAPYLASFLDTLSVDYGAEMVYLDMANQPEAVINQWVEEETFGLIQDMLQPGAIDASTYIVLANAIYFRAPWLNTFNPGYTHERPFRLLDGTELAVPTMVGEGWLPYYVGDGFQALELHYLGEEASMVFIMPEEGQFGSFEAALDMDTLGSIFDKLQTKHMVLALPKFSFATGFDLAARLREMGMTSAFGPGANFSGMDGVNDGVPWIGVAAHEAFISIDEEGTMAAGGTVLEFTLGEVPPVDFDRPFIFVIRDIETGTILFLGRVLDPAE